MSKRFTYYLAGLATGIILGIGLMVIFQSGRQANPSKHDLSEKYVDNKKVKTEQKSGSVEKIVSDSNENHNGLQTTKIDTTITQDTTASADSLDTISPKADTIEQKQDTVPDENDFVVMQDKLIATSQKPVIHTNDIPKEATSDNKNLDSLLIDDPNTNTKEPDSLMVEFWKNPINYKGYRRIKNRLIIFGMTEEDSIKIFKTRDNYFMKIRNKKFPLDETNNFRPIWFDD